MIRKIVESDAKDIRDICDISLGYSQSTEFVKKQINKLSNDSHHIIYVYIEENEDKCVAFIHVELFECLYIEKGFNILGLAVLPKYQNNGAGKKLMAHIEDEAKKMDYKFIRINSGMEREKAHNFYKSLGYDGDKLQKRFIKFL